MDKKVIPNERLRQDHSSLYELVMVVVENSDLTKAVEERLKRHKDDTLMAELFNELRQRKTPAESQLKRKFGDTKYPKIKERLWDAILLEMSEIYLQGDKDKSHHDYHFANTLLHYGLNSQAFIYIKKAQLHSLQSGDLITYYQTLKQEARCGNYAGDGLPMSHFIGSIRERSEAWTEDFYIINQAWHLYLRFMQIERKLMEGEKWEEIESELNLIQTHDLYNETDIGRLPIVAAMYLYKIKRSIAYQEQKYDEAISLTLHLDALIERKKHEKNEHLAPMELYNWYADAMHIFLDGKRMDLYESNLKALEALFGQCFNEKRDKLARCLLYKYQLESQRLAKTLEIDGLIKKIEDFLGSIPFIKSFLISSSILPKGEKKGKEHIDGAGALPKMTIDAPYFELAASLAIALFEMGENKMALKYTKLFENNRNKSNSLDSFSVIELFEFLPLWEIKDNDTIRTKIVTIAKRLEREGNKKTNAATPYEEKEASNPSDLRKEVLNLMRRITDIGKALRGKANHDDFMLFKTNLGKLIESNDSFTMFFLSEFRLDHWIKSKIPESPVE